MNTSEKLAKRLLKPINTSAILLLGGYTVLWGMWVGNPLWSVFSRADLYSSMAQLAPEYVWGLLAIACGAVTIYGVLRPSYRSLLIGAAIVGWHWGLICLMYFMGDWQATGGLSAGIFAVYSVFIYLNIKFNKKRLGLDNNGANAMLRSKNY